MKDMIERWSGLHPFLVQLACDFFFRLVDEGEDIEGRSENYLLKRFLSRHKKHFAYFWRQLDSDEQTGLEKVLKGEELGNVPTALLDRLEKGYYIQNGTGGPQIFSTAFATYMATRTK